MRRFDGSGDFNRSWDEYKDGFGDANGESWLGNEYIHHLTNTRPYKLRFDLEDWDNNTAYAEYSSFVVTSEADEYRLLLGDYSGNASADASEDTYHGFLYHNNQQFTTYDQDNDDAPFNCVLSIDRGHRDRFGGFWYKDCARVTPTNIYCHSSSCGDHSFHIRFKSWRRSLVSLKKLKMLMRPVTY